MARAPIDKPLVLSLVTVKFLDGSTHPARAEGNNCSWVCKCNDRVPLLGRCYYQFNDTCFTLCPTCDRKYRVTGVKRAKGRGKQANAILEIE